MPKVYRLNEVSTEIVVDLPHLKATFLKYLESYDMLADDTSWRLFWDDLTKENDSNKTRS